MKTFEEWWVVVEKNLIADGKNDELTLAALEVVANGAWAACEQQFRTLWQSNGEAKMKWNEKWQCPYCLKNDCDVNITEHRDPYATGDSPTEYEVVTTCCGVDAVEAGTYCQCGNEVYDDGMCLYCYAEHYEKEEKETEMKVLDMTVAELIKRGAFVDVHLHNTDEKTGTAFVKEMTGQDAEQYEFDSFTSYARAEGMVSVTSYVRRNEDE